VILWNKALHPGVVTIADVAKQVPAVSVFGDRPFMRYFVENGLVPADKVDSNYKGSLLLATDDIAHQGFATSEPFRYQNLESGPVEVGYQLIHEAGWTSYPQNLAINKLRLEALRPCLAKLVPMMQHAQIDFVTSPDRTVNTILNVVTQLNTSWTQSAELAAYAVETMKTLGIVRLPLSVILNPHASMSSSTRPYRSSGVKASRFRISQRTTSQRTSSSIRQSACRSC
jgi:hypothetical protein